MKGKTIIATNNPKKFKLEQRKAERDVKLSRQVLPKKRGRKLKVVVAPLEDSNPQLLSCSDNDLETFSDLVEREEFEPDLYFGVNDFTFVKFEMKK